MIRKIMAICRRLEKLINSSVCGEIVAAVDDDEDNDAEEEEEEDDDNEDDNDDRDESSDMAEDCLELDMLLVEVENVDRESKLSSSVVTNVLTRTISLLPSSTNTKSVRNTPKYGTSADLQ